MKLLIKTETKDKVIETYGLSCALHSIAVDIVSGGKYERFSVSPKCDGNKVKELENETSDDCMRKAFIERVRMADNGSLYEFMGKRDGIAEKIAEIAVYQK